MKVYSLDKNGGIAFTLPFRSFVKGVNHRGYCNVAPENTLPAYILSAKMGFRYVETDISFTAPDNDNPNGVPVLLHDDTIDRTSNGTGSLSSMTLAQVRQYDFGSWKSATYIGTKIPTLEEFLALCRNLGLHAYLELKTSGGYSTQKIGMIVDMVNRMGMKGNVTYISFSNVYLGWVTDHDESARLAYVVNSVTSTKISEALALITGKNEVVIDSGAYSAEQVTLCKNANLPLELWAHFDSNNKQVIFGLDDYVSGVTNNSLNAEYVLYDKSLG